VGPSQHISLDGQNRDWGGGGGGSLPQSSLWYYKRPWIEIAKYNTNHIRYTGCLKKNAMEIQKTVVHHKLN
jgi:hypothetical protein